MYGSSLVFLFKKYSRPKIFLIECQCPQLYCWRLRYYFVHLLLTVFSFSYNFQLVAPRFLSDNLLQFLPKRFARLFASMANENNSNKLISLKDFVQYNKPSETVKLENLL